jgi:hypothetical protein
MTMPKGYDPKKGNLAQDNNNNDVVAEATTAA